MNLRPSGYEPDELPDCSTPRRYKSEMEEEGGFEPPRGLTRLSVFKTDPFSQTWVFLRKIYKWWTLQDSNLRPDGYEPSALTN